MKTRLMMLTPTSPRPPNDPEFSVGLPRGDNDFYVSPLCGKSLSVAGGALFGLALFAQPFEHAFAEPNHFGSNAFVAGIALTSRASPCLRKALSYRDTGRVPKSRLSQARQGSES